MTVDYFTMKQHAIATYLQLIVGCDRVLYDAEWWETREQPIDLIGVKQKSLAVIVDIADKFASYPKGMRLSTWKRKLVRRFVSANERLKAWGFKKTQGEVWFFGAPLEQLEIALPSVTQTLWREQKFPLDVVPTPEVRRRLTQAADAVREHGKDIGNPFAQAILLASGTLETPPKDAEGMPTQFPLELSDPYAIPAFIDAFLSSGYVVNWLGFDAPAFTALYELARQQRSSAWWELEQWLNMEGEERLRLERWEEGGGLALFPKYSQKQIVGVISWLMHNAARALDAWHERWREPLLVEVGFLLPYLFKNPPLPPELIEAEIVRYGGDRDIARAHFQPLLRPDKRLYRGYFRLVLQGPYDPAPKPPGLPAMEVPLRHPFLPRGVTVSLSVLYPPEFAGYFLVTFQVIAQIIRLRVERFRET